MKIIIKNWFILTAGLILNAVYIRISFRERGYMAAGGEWMILPAFMAIKSMIGSMVKEILRG